MNIVIVHSKGGKDTLPNPEINERAQELTAIILIVILFFAIIYKITK